MQLASNGAVAPHKFASIPPPPISDKTTPAFRVSDMKRSGADFMSHLAALLQGAGLDDTDHETWDLSSLRAKSEEEEMLELERELGVQQQQQQSSDQNANVGSYDAVKALQESTEEDAAMEEAGSEAATEDQRFDSDANEAGPSTAAAPVYLPWYDKPGRAAAQQAFDDLANQARQRRKQRREEASAVLTTLRDTGGGGPAGGLPVAPETRNRQLNRLRKTMYDPAMENKPRVDSNECIIHVAIHVPHAPAHLSEEWLVLGSQPLSALRDALYCLTDVNVKAVQDQENNQRAVTDQPLIQLSKPSAYLYIEGTFYNDMRDPAAVDYSAPIRAYLKQQGVPAPPHPHPRQQSEASSSRHTLASDYSVAKMEDTKFEDLWLRLGAGAPALYCHQGSCEHLVVFKDVRMYAPGADPPCIESYPFKLTTNSMLLMFRQCEACESKAAKRVTFNDLQAPHTPYFWCDECYKLMHYDDQGRVIEPSYQVFPYSHEYYQTVLSLPSKAAANKAKSRALLSQSAPTTVPVLSGTEEGEEEVIEGSDDDELQAARQLKNLFNDSQ